MIWSGAVDAVSAPINWISVAGDVSESGRARRPWLRYRVRFGAGSGFVCLSLQSVMGSFGESVNRQDDLVQGWPMDPVADPINRISVAGEMSESGRARRPWLRNRVRFGAESGFVCLSLRSIMGSL
jgi:hypothetical protein